MGNKNILQNQRITAKQRRFVEEYLVDLNATQAAIRAGYSQKTARQIGEENLSKPYIAALVKVRMGAREKRTEISQDRVLNELAKIGFADIRKAIRWGDGIAVRVAAEEGTPEGEDGVIVVNDVALIGSENLDDDTAAAIAEISQSARGLKVKLHDKRAALVDIGRHLGMFPSKVELTGKDGAPLEFRPVRELSDAEIDAELTRLEGENARASTPQSKNQRTSGGEKKAAPRKNTQGGNAPPRKGNSKPRAR